MKKYEILEKMQISNISSLWSVAICRTKYCQMCHAPDDEDLLIYQKAMESDITTNTVLICDDT